MFAARFESFMVASGRSTLAQIRGNRPQSNGFRRLAPKSVQTQETRRPEIVQMPRIRQQLPTLEVQFRSLCAAM